MAILCWSVVVQWPGPLVPTKRKTVWKMGRFQRFLPPSLTLASLKLCFHFISPVVCPPFFLRLSVSKGLSLLRRVIHLQVTLLPQPFLHSLLCPEVSFSKRPCKKLSEIPSWERCWLLLVVSFLGLCLGSLASRGIKVAEQSDQGLLGTPTHSSLQKCFSSQNVLSPCFIFSDSHRAGGRS